MQKTIVALPGDGIGPEVMAQAIKVLNKIAKKYNHEFHLLYGLIGGAAYDKYQNHFPDETKTMCQKADAILFGSVGGPVDQMDLPKWQNCERNSILALRKHLQLCINLRPTRLYPELTALSPIKSSVIQPGLDFIIVRELMGDIYFGEHKQWLHNNVHYASDLAEYNEQQIASAAHFAFQLASKRRQKVTLVDKANVLETSRLWRKIVADLSKQYEQVKLEYMLVDSCAMQLIINPSQFDVLLTANLFGDILSDQAAALTGTLGMMPSASFNNQHFGLFEPAGGSAPDIAGKNSANPIAQIFSLALMFRYAFALDKEATAVENAIYHALQNNYRTKDMMSEGNILVSTEEITDIILERL